jgi:hypothetical protein
LRERKITWVFRACGEGEDWEKDAIKSNDAVQR